MKRDLTIPFRGSRNQKIIDVTSSLAQNEPIEIEKYKLEEKYETKMGLV